MSDEHTKTKHRFSVDVDDFVRFLEAKTLDRKCPACGTAHWTVIGPAEGATYRVTAPLRDSETKHQLSMFAIHCVECGFVRQHYARVVKDWVKDNPRPEQLEFDEILGDDE